MHGGRFQSTITIEWASAHVSGSLSGWFVMDHDTGESWSTPQIDEARRIAERHAAGRTVVKK